MTDDEIYQKFIEYLNNPVWEFTESEWMMPMITSFISPEEAEFLTGFPLSGKNIETIAALKDMTVDEIRPKIKALCGKGLIYESKRGDSIRYRLWTSMEMFVRVAHWRDDDSEMMRQMSHYANKYYMDGWYDQHNDFKHPELRAIPIETTVEPNTTFLPYEDIIKVVDNYEYYTVSHCPCRMRHKQDPDYEESHYPSEVCLHFNELGHYIVDHDLGREITREETLEILKSASAAGLVHGISNEIENPETI